MLRSLIKLDLDLLGVPFIGVSPDAGRFFILVNHFSYFYVGIYDILAVFEAKK